MRLLPPNSGRIKGGIGIGYGIRIYDIPCNFKSYLRVTFFKNNKISNNFVDETWKKRYIITKYFFKYVC